MAEKNFGDQRKFRPRSGAEVRYRSSDAVKAIATVSDILKCEERGSPLSVLEYDRYVIKHKLPFPNSSTVRALLITWENGLIAANVNYERKKSSKAETGFTALDVENWIMNFIQTNGKKPTPDDINLARNNKQLPEDPEKTNKLLKDKLKVGFKELIRMCWARYQVRELDK